MRIDKANSCLYQSDDGVDRVGVTGEALLRNCLQTKYHNTTLPYLVQKKQKGVVRSKSAKDLKSLNHALPFSNFCPLHLV